MLRHHLELGDTVLRGFRPNSQNHGACAAASCAQFEPVFS